MGQQTIPVLKEKFADGKTPPGSDFADLIDSYVHKSTKINQSQILGLNEDFATKDELSKATTKFKGYHTTLAKLQNEYPQAENIKDFFAWVGSPYPGTVYKVFADGGAWTDTGEVPTQEEIDLAEYAKKTDLAVKADEIDSEGNVVVRALTGTHLISPQQIVGANVGQSGNIVPSLSFTDGKYLYKATGAEGTLAAFSYSDYIDVSKCEEIIVSSVPENGGCFYDSNKTFMSGFGFAPPTQVDVTIPVPDGAKFARVNLSIAARQDGTAYILLVKNDASDDGKYTLDWLMLTPEQVPAITEPSDIGGLDNTTSVVLYGKGTKNLFSELDNGGLQNSLFQVSKTSGSSLSFQAYANEIEGYSYKNKLVSNTNAASNKFDYSINSSLNKLSFGVWVKQSDFSDNKLIAVHFSGNAGGVKYVNLRISVNGAGDKMTFSTTYFNAYAEVYKQVGDYLFIRGYCAASATLSVILYDAFGAVRGNSSNFGAGDSSEIGGQVANKQYTRVGWIFTDAIEMIDPQNIVSDANLLKVKMPSLVAYLGEQLGGASTSPVIALHDINTYVGDTLQLFKSGFLLCENYADYSLNAFIVENAKLGKSLPRYFEFTASAAGTYTLRLELYNNTLMKIASKDITITVKAKVAPISKKNILLIGDSLTQGNDNNSGVNPANKPTKVLISQEVKRILSSSEAATAIKPAGLSYNVQLIGSQASTVARHEGYGGYSWQTFLGSSSPFYKGGKIDFNAYLAQTGVYDDTARMGVDLIYIGLGLNDTANLIVTNEGGQLFFDASPILSNARTFLNYIKTQIKDGTSTYKNPNIKVVLWCEPFSAGRGGYAYHPYGSMDGYTKLIANYKRYAVYKAYTELVKEADYSSWVSVCYATPQIDVENTYCYINKQINKRMADTEVVQIEDVHPDGNGYSMIGEALSRDIVGKL